MKASVIGFLLMLVVPLTSSAAERITTKQLESTVEKAVVEKEADWRPKKLGPYQKEGPDGVQRLRLLWVPREGVTVLSALDGKSPHPRPRAWVEISLYLSPEKAADDLHDPSGASSRPRAVVKDLGDEAYIWGPSADGSVIVRARAGRAYIEVGGPSADVTMRFAQLTTEEVSKELAKAGDR